MSSKQTESNQEKMKISTDWMPTSGVGKTKPTARDIEEKFKERFDKGVIDEDLPNRNLTKDNKNSIGADNSIETEDSNNTVGSQQTESTDAARSAVSKRTSGKQRKESLEEYKQTFLSVPTLEDRKPVFISCEVRDKLDEIVRKLGGRRMSVSGFIENLARNHLETYQGEVESWKKL